MGAWLYILKCSDGCYYTGTTRGELDGRVAEHQTGTFDGFTSTRRPVTLKYSEHFERIVDAIAAEQQIKRWSRAKKEALIAGDFSRLSHLAERRKSGGPHGSRRAASPRSSP
jgi:putative endonuclease